VDLRERSAWREFVQNPCPDTAYRWATIHARSVTELADLLIDDIEGMGNREKNLLKGAGIDTFEKLTRAYRTQLGEIKGCGPAHRSKIAGFLAANGIKLRAKPKTEEDYRLLCESIPYHNRSAYDRYWIERMYRCAKLNY